MSSESGIWSQTELAGHVCHIFEPARPSEYGYVVVYLHGSRGASLADHPAFVQQFARHGLRVVEPATGRSWWTDRIWPEFDPEISAEKHILDRVLPYIQLRWNSESPRLALLGTSMGGQGALRIAYKHPNVFPTVAALSPAVDFQKRIVEGVDPGLNTMYSDEEDARQDSALLHIHPLNWPRNQFFCCDPADMRWYDSADRLRMKLFSLGVPFECDMETTAGGHGFPYWDHMAERVVNFLADRLEQERLRVV